MKMLNATALRAFSHADDTFAAKQVILDMEAGQFADWSAEGVGLVREATPAEVATVRGDKPTAPTKPRSMKRATAAKPVPATPDPAPPSGDA